MNKKKIKENTSLGNIETLARNEEIIKAKLRSIR
jgi:hypothetical protein